MACAISIIVCLISGKRVASTIMIKPAIIANTNGGKLASLLFVLTSVSASFGLFVHSLYYSDTATKNRTIMFIMYIVTLIYINIIDTYRYVTYMFRNFVAEYLSRLILQICLKPYLRYYSADIILLVRILLFMTYIPYCLNA